MTLADKTIVGVLWNFLEQFARKGVGITVTLFLAYFLTPQDFGLMAMMVLFLALGGVLMESGFKEALIRLKHPTQKDFNTAFYANIILAVFAYIVLFFSAPFIADFYARPVLVDLIRLAGLGIIVNAFRSVQVAVFSRELNFKIQLLANLPAALISGVLAVVLAYLGWGVLALIAQMLVSSLLATLVFWVKSTWSPSLEVSFHSLMQMYRFGYKLFLSAVLDTIFRNIYLVVIAKFLDATTAGLYYFSEKIKDLLTQQLISAIQSVTYPALSGMQDDDARLKAAYKKVIVVTTFLVFPIMAFLAALAQPLFMALFPEKWWGGVVYFQLMALAGLLYPLHAINMNILKVKGRSDLFLYIEIIKKIVIAVILFCSFRFGVIAIIIGQILSSVLAYIPNSYYSARLIGYGIKEQVADFIPGLLLAVFVAGLLYGAQYYLEWWALAELSILGIVGMILYVLGAYLLKVPGYDLARVIVLAKLNRKRRS